MLVIFNFWSRGKVN